MNTTRRHTCVLVGAGPGDPDLLTIKAVKALRCATVVLVDDLVDRRVLRWVRRTARIVEVGKRGGCSSTPQAFIERLMVHEVLRGEKVVRLKGGDPLVFGRAGEEMAALAAAGIEVEVINGITSGLAAAADLGLSLTHRDCAQGVLFMTGHGREDGRHRVMGDGKDGSTVDWRQIGITAGSGVTLVIYMAMARLEHIREGLLQSLPSSTPVALVERASQAAGRQVSGVLGELATLAEAHRIASPAILVVGPVVRQRKRQPRDTAAPALPASGALPENAGLAGMNSP